MERVKQINRWIIKKKSEGELTRRYNREENNRFSVYSPEGKHMEEWLTLEQAENFCRTNLDYMKKK